MEKRIILFALIGGILLLISARLFISPGEEQKPLLIVPPSQSLTTLPSTKETQLVHEDTAKQQQTGRSLSTPRQIASLLEDLEALEDHDQKRLNHLYGQMRNLILLDEEGFFQYLNDIRSQLPTVPLEKSFFLITSAIRYSNQPLKNISLILDYSLETEHINSARKPTQRLKRIKAFAIRKLTLCSDRGEIALTINEKQELLPRLLSIAKKEPSLDLAREAMKLIIRISDHPSSHLQEILHIRPANERDIFADLI